MRTFFLSFVTSKKIFETTKYSLERSFQKEYEYQKKKSNFLRKTLRSNLTWHLVKETQKLKVSFSTKFLRLLKKLQNIFYWDVHFQ